MHTTTFGGNPLACAAAIATIGVLIEEKLPERAAEVGEYFLKELKNAAKGHEDKVQEIRGQGLMIGIEFHKDEIGYEVSKGMFNLGVLVAGTLINSKTIRMEPALTISYKEVDQVVSTFKQVLVEVKE
jgi:putrescine aminotransferase